MHVTKRFLRVAKLEGPSVSIVELAPASSRASSTAPTGGAGGGRAVELRHPEVHVSIAHTEGSGHGEAKRRTNDMEKHEERGTGREREGVTYRGGGCTVTVTPWVDEYSVLHVAGSVACNGEGWFRVRLRYSDGHEVVFPNITPELRRKYRCLRNAGNSIPVPPGGSQGFDYTVLLLPGFPRPVEAYVEAYSGGRKMVYRVDLARFAPVYKFDEKTIIVEPGGRHEQTPSSTSRAPSRLGRGEELVAL